MVLTLGRFANEGQVKNEVKERSGLHGKPGGEPPPQHAQKKNDGTTGAKGGAILSGIQQQAGIW